MTSYATLDLSQDDFLSEFHFFLRDKYAEKCTQLLEGTRKFHELPLCGGNVKNDKDGFSAGQVCLSMDLSSPVDLASTPGTSATDTTSKALGTALDV